MKTVSLLTKLALCGAVPLLMLGGPAVAADDEPSDSHYGNFFTTQPALEYAYIFAAGLDMGMTMDIKHHKSADGTWQLEEKNPILGPHPSDAKVVGYFAATTALHMAITDALIRNDAPKPVVATWELVTIGVEATFVGNNYKVGVRCKF